MNEQMKNGIAEIGLNEMEKIAGGSDSKYTLYTVQKGDTLHRIARSFHVTVEDLMRWNHIKNPNLLLVDTELKIYHS